MSIRKHLLGKMMVFHAFLGVTAVAAEGVVEADLNGLKLVLDADTGSILEMSYPGVGKMIDTPTSRASIIDMALPIKAWEPLRLASRYSSGARIEKTADSVTITWDALAAAAMVAVRSVRPSSRSHREPGGMRPGQQAMNGTRWPPSHASVFCPSKGPLGDVRLLTARGYTDRRYRW